MKALVFILILFSAVSCERSMTVDVSASGVLISVQGCPEFPFVTVEKGVHADLILDVVATHIRTGKKTETEVRLKRDSSVIWEKKPDFAGFADGNKRFYGDSSGVEATFSYSDEKDGMKRREDSAKIMIPFGANLKGAEGVFLYEAIWKKG